MKGSFGRCLRPRPPLCLTLEILSYIDQLFKLSHLFPGHGIHTYIAKKIDKCISYVFRHFCHKAHGHGQFALAKAVTIVLPYFQNILVVL